MLQMSQMDTSPSLFTKWFSVILCDQVIIVFTAHSTENNAALQDDDNLRSMFYRSF